MKTKLEQSRQNSPKAATEVFELNIVQTLRGVLLAGVSPERAAPAVVGNTGDAEWHVLNIPLQK